MHPMHLYLISYQYQLNSDQTQFVQRKNWLCVPNVSNSALCMTVQSCLTLCDAMDCGLQGSSVHGILPAKYWSGLPFPSPRNLALGSSKRLLISPPPKILPGYFLFIPKVGRNIWICLISWINMLGYKSACKWFLKNPYPACGCLLVKGRIKIPVNPSQAPLQNLSYFLLTQGVALGWYFQRCS